MASLENLPFELQGTICRYTSTVRGKGTPLLALSQVSKTCNQIVEAHCISELRTLRARFPNSAPKQPFATKAYTARKRYLNFIWTHCIFCHRKSVRRASMVVGWTACQACDEKEWPGAKILLPKAVKSYRITEGELFVPGVTRGEVMHGATWTPIFFEADVRRIACAVHGRRDEDLDAFLEAERTRPPPAVAAKIELLAERNLQELRELLKANGYAEQHWFDDLRALLPVPKPIKGKTRPTPRDLVRNHMLHQRLLNETDYAQHRTVPDVNHEGKPDVLLRWECAGRHGAADFVSSPPHPYDGLEARDARDEALMQLFIKDYGPLPGADKLAHPRGEILSRATYRKWWSVPRGKQLASGGKWLATGPPSPEHDSETSSGWEDDDDDGDNDDNDDGPASGGGSAPADFKPGYWGTKFYDGRFHLWGLEHHVAQRTPPWIWEFFPVFVKRVYVRDVEKERAGDFVDEAIERRKVAAWNTDRAQEFARVGEWVRTVVFNGGLDAADFVRPWRMSFANFVSHAKWSQRFFQSSNRDQRRLQEAEYEEDWGYALDHFRDLKAASFNHFDVYLAELRDLPPAPDGRGDGIRLIQDVQYGGIVAKGPWKERVYNAHKLRIGHRNARGWVTATVDGWTIGHMGDNGVFTPVVPDPRRYARHMKASELEDKPEKRRFPSSDGPGDGGLAAWHRQFRADHPELFDQ